MKVLIVEDDENKRVQLERLIGVTVPGSEIAVAKSYHSALAAVLAAPYDLILLDMTMPTYDIGDGEDGGRPQHYAGREILRQLDRRNIRTRVIVVTQFDKFGEGADALSRPQLDSQLRQEHPSNYFGTVYYNAAQDDWKDELVKAIRP